MTMQVTVLRNRLTKFSIRVHISVLFLLILLVSTLLSGSLYRQLYGDMALSRVSDASLLTLNSIRANLDAVIRNANNTSKMILSDSDLQALLATGDLYSDLRLQGRIRSFLYKVLQDTPDIDSIHLFDNTGNQYTISRRIRQRQPRIVLRDAPWYQATVEGKGAYVLRLNGDGDFPGDENGNRVSLMRTVRDINTTESIGTLVVNISEAAFHQAFGTISQQYDTEFFLLDGNGASILRSATISDGRRAALSSFLASGMSNAAELKLDGVPYLVSFQRESVYGWTLLSLVPTDILSNENMPVFLTGFIVIGLNGVLLFVGLLLIARMITTPIGRLLASMRQVEAGVLEPWDIRAGNREILQLRNNYNRMIERIRLLLHRVVVEQKAKRRHELNVLQAQIKPHFLYNTLDSINALALMGEKESVVRIVDALGVYYRLSLGRGREVVTVEDETEMVRHYLSIQKIRYADLFEVVYNLDAKAGSQPLLKLVLQPLVENALYHGIRASGHKGTLWLTTHLEEKHVRITLSDNGCGMKQEVIDRVLRAEWDEASAEGGVKSAVTPSGSGSGFGLRGTIERLRIFYGRNDVMTIMSESGKGTHVTLLVPTGDAWFVKGTERILNGDESQEHDTLLHEMMTEEDGS